MFDETIGTAFQPSFSRKLLIRYDMSSSRQFIWYWIWYGPISCGCFFPPSSIAASGWWIAITMIDRAEGMTPCGLILTGAPAKRPILAIPTRSARSVSSA